MAKVRAIRKCFFDGHHRDPDKEMHRIFDVPSRKQFSEIAMELLEGESFPEDEVKEEPEVKTKPKAKAKAKAKKD